jgi:high-affinity iron transporter
LAWTPGVYRFGSLIRKAIAKLISAGEAVALAAKLGHPNLSCYGAALVRANEHDGSDHTRLAWWLSGLAVVAGLVYLMATASTGPADPTESAKPTSHATVVFNSGMIVFREGLEAILIFAAVTASFLGANKAKRRPVALGAAIAFGATVVTWFVVQAILHAASPLGPKLEAITGFIAIVVLLVVLNWFVHRVYWTDWIGRHHRRRQELLTQTGAAALIGLVALGFTTVYREGFEVVLFLQNLQLQNGTSMVLEGVALGLACTAVVGVIAFWLHRKLPYRRMLILTGALVAVVLMVMIGGTALSFMDLGWIPSHPTPFSVPEWMGTWFEIYPYWETIGAQLLAGALVVGSYLIAEHVKVRRRVKRGEQPAIRAEAPPPAVPQAESA